MTHLSESEATLLREGDPELFKKLIREHTGSLLGWVRSYADGPDDADDLVQEVWRRVIGKRSTYRGTGSFRGWLYRVARSVCVDHSRRGSAKRTGREELDAQLKAEALADVRTQAASAATETPGAVAAERLALRTVRDVFARLISRIRYGPTRSSSGFSGRSSCL